MDRKQETRRLPPAACQRTAPVLAWNLSNWVFLCDTQPVTSCCSTVSAALHTLSGTCFRSLTDVVPHGFSCYLADRWPWLTVTHPLLLLLLFLYFGELTSDEEEVEIFINDSERTFPNVEKQEVLKSKEDKSLNARFFSLLWQVEPKGTVQRIHWWSDKEQCTSESKTFSLFYCVVCVYLTADIEDLTQPVFCYWDTCHWSTSTCNSRKQQRAENDSCATWWGAETHLNETWKSCWDWENTYPSTTSAMRCDSD